ncbi:MaoC family dehydratase [Flavisphingomonas formosensis]|uniref:MaoC family dehydratase n=1 Tax=Flavisphingomonas formosensis TaxID=861534 RepID=UPI0012FABCC8|nr:MaoC family dehydratase [Sphingomonas formosensis]
MSDILNALLAEVGIARHSQWLSIDQAMINRFADATLDYQYIHLDPERAAATPFGGTVAHGFLTLSLLPRLMEITARPPIPQVRMGVNYGFDRVRFIAPVRSGSRVRAVSTVTSVEQRQPGQLQQISDIIVEIEGGGKPALTAVWLTQFFA